MGMNTVPWGRWRVGGAGPSMAVTAAQSIVTHGLTWGTRPATQESSPANERSPLTKPLPLFLHLGEKGLGPGLVELNADPAPGDLELCPNPRHGGAAMKLMQGEAGSQRGPEHQSDEEPPGRPASAVHWFCPR